MPPRKVTWILIVFQILHSVDVAWGLTLVDDPASFVVPFIGTVNQGHVFPGATIPHGMVKAGMDTDSPGNHAGYDGDPRYGVIGFSQLHDDGTGGAPPLSNFKLYPYADCPSLEACQTSIWTRRVYRVTKADGSPDDAASPGYFSSIRVELTATRRTALHRYTFHPGTTHPRILVDFTNEGQKTGSNPVGTVDPSGRISGGASFFGSFGPGWYDAFTCVDFKGDGYELGTPTEYGIFVGNQARRNETDIEKIAPAYAESGGIYTFKPAPGNVTTIIARVGISFISAKQACQNGETEIPDFDFERVHKEARAQWNELLGRIQIDSTSVDEESTKLFYSSLYRTHISPADYTGENPRWNSTEPYYDSLYCNWDTYRTLYPLMSLHDPVRLAEVVRGMIDIQKHEGWLPECRGATIQQSIQGGSNADPILGEFFVKFSEYANALNVSAIDLYHALVTDAEDQPANWDLQGRQAVPWKQYGYIPITMYEQGGMNTRYVSRTLEYAFDDFTIAQVAKILGYPDDVSKYMHRAGNFINVWNPNVTVPDDPSIIGMMQPRYSNGSFGYTDPRHCSVRDPNHSTCYLDWGNFDGFYESSPLVYSQYVPHDTAKLIDLQGGVENFISRLDFLFDNDYFDSTNEPSQQIPFMYHYANRPGFSTQRSREIVAKYYSTRADGLPGNDDSGAMGSYIAFYLLGMYPLPATRQILLSSPYFARVSLYNPLYNTTTTVISHGFTGNPTNGTGGNVFVKSVSVDGKPYKSNCYLDWDIFVYGSLVELTLTDDIHVTCGEGVGALPPSMSTGRYD